MSFQIKDTVGTSKQFYFDGSRLLDAMVQILTDSSSSNGFDGLEYQFGGDDPIKDRDNINILKEELGVILIEKNNNDGDMNIKNNHKLNLYKDLVRTNNFLAAMFLLYTFSTNLIMILCQIMFSRVVQKMLMLTKIIILMVFLRIKEIKTIYPFMHNLFVKLLEIRYGSQANIAIMKVQDAEENLQETELNSQIQKIKTKKNPKIQFSKK